jgi:hypothetical protein
MKKMLIIRPNYDIGTNYLFLWSQEVIDFATQKNWHVEKSDGEKATKQEAKSLCTKEEWERDVMTDSSQCYCREKSFYKEK